MPGYRFSRCLRLSELNREQVCSPRGFFYPRRTFLFSPPAVAARKAQAPGPARHKLLDENLSLAGLAQFSFDVREDIILFAQGVFSEVTSAITDPIDCFSSLRTEILALGLR